MSALARCECPTCTADRYARFGNIIDAALTHDTPNNLAAVAMTGIRPLHESKRRALLVPVRHRTKDISNRNLNR